MYRGRYEQINLKYFRCFCWSLPPPNHCEHILVAVLNPEFSCHVGILLEIVLINEAITGGFDILCYKRTSLSKTIPESVVIY